MDTIVRGQNGNPPIGSGDTQPLSDDSLDQIAGGAFQASGAPVAVQITDVPCPQCKLMDDIIGYEQSDGSLMLYCGKCGASWHVKA